MFLLTDLATTTSEGEGISLTITPETALDKDYIIRYFITGAGLHPEATGALILSSGYLEFESGATAPLTTTIGRNINNHVRDYSKGLSVKIASYEVDAENPQRVETNEKILVDDHHVTIIDTEDTIEKPIFDVPSSPDKDLALLGNSFDAPVITQGAGNDLYIITRHMNKTHLISDTDGQNIIKFDSGVEITNVRHTSSHSRGESTVSEVRISINSGGRVDIELPAGNLYQIGDNALLSFEEFHDAIIKGGFTSNAADAVLNRAYKIDEQQDAYPVFHATDADITVAGLTNNLAEGQILSLTLAPSATLSAVTTVNWEIIGVGRLPISKGDITTTSGVLTFAANATSSDSQTLSIPVQDNLLVDHDRQFLLKMELKGASGTSEPLVTNYLVTITDNEAKSEGELYQSATVYDDVILLGNNNRKELLSGLPGDDIFVVTRHVVSDVEFVDVKGHNIIKFDKGVVIISVKEDEFQLGSLLINNGLTLTLETGAKLMFATPSLYGYQIEDGLVMTYEDFLSTVTAGGFTTDSQNQDTTTLSTPFAVTKPSQPSALTLSHKSITIFEGKQSADKDLATIKSNLAGYDVSVSDNRFKVQTTGTDHILQLKANTEFDYEAGADLELSIRYAKAGEEDVTANFTVHLADKNEAPTITNVATSYTLTEDAAVSTTATQTSVIIDQDAGDTAKNVAVSVQYTAPRTIAVSTQNVLIGDVLALSASYGTLHITRAQDGNFSFYYALNNSNNNVNGLLGNEVLLEQFSFHVADDQDLGNSLAVQIDIAGRNDTPVLSQILTPTSFDEGVYNDVTDTAYSFRVTDPDGTPTLSLSGDDRFSLTYDDASSRYKLQIKAASEFDYETVSDRSVTLTITATDNLDNTLTDTRSVVVSFADINEAPTIDQGVGFINIEADTPLNYNIASDAFSDQDANDPLSYSVTMADGSALPSWLRFANNQLTGTPAASDIKRYVLDITATDKGGLTVTDKLVIARELTATTLDNNSFYLGTAHNTHSGGRLVGTITVNQEAHFNATFTGADASYFTATNDNGVLSIYYKDGVTDDSRAVGTVYDVALVIADSDSASRKLTFDNLNIIQGREVTFVPSIGRNIGVGTAGDDVAVAPDNGVRADVRTGDGNDLIYGSDLNDIIRSGAGNDTIYARGGVDQVFVESGANIIDGGDGNDTIDFSTAGSGVNIDLSVATDEDGFYRPTGGGLEGTKFKNFESFTLSGFDDVFKGDGGKNVIRAEGGADTLYGYGGDDQLFADGVGNTIYGGDGDDELTLGTTSVNGKNDLYGEAGNDTIGGNVANDHLYGGDGNDHITGDKGDDFLYGGAGDDTLSAGNGDDYIEGGSGADEIRGGAGFDTLSYAKSSQAVSVVLAIVQIENQPTVYNSVGSTGGHAQGDEIREIEYIIGSDHDDIFYAGSGADTIDGGKGNNTLSYEYSTVNELIKIDLSADKDDDGFVTASSGGYAQGDKFKNIQNLIGTAARAVNFTGDDQDNILTALSHLGNILNGGAGNDTLTGGEDFYFHDNGNKIQHRSLGRDTLDGGAGNDIIYGKSGNDTIFGSAGGDAIDGGENVDTLTYINSNAGITMNFTTATYDDDGYISGFTGGYAEGDKIKDIETINATTFDDVIINGHADATKSATIVNFYLLEGDDNFTGADVMENVFSGAGNDIIKTNGGNDIVKLEGGNNHLDLGDGDDELITDDEVSSSDRNIVYGKAGRDNLNGGKSIDQIYGGDGDDRIQGFDNDDSLYGGAGNDFIANGEGDDVVDGGSGVDTINLDKGKDIITGGSGTDIFKMSRFIGLDESSGQDFFTDFEQGEKLRLDLTTYSDSNKFEGTTMSDVLMALRTGDQTDKWKISKGHVGDAGGGTNDASKQDTYIHYGVYGQSDYYVRFVFEDLDFELSASNFEIV